MKKIRCVKCINNHIRLAEIKNSRVKKIVVRKKKTFWTLVLPE